MNDAIGQEIKVGDKVVACGGMYSQAKVQEVIKITAKRVQVPSTYEHAGGGTFLAPDSLIVVTGNLIRLALGVDDPKCEYCGRNPNGEPQLECPDFS